MNNDFGDVKQNLKYTGALNSYPHGVEVLGPYMISSIKTGVAKTIYDTIFPVSSRLYFTLCGGFHDEF